MAIIKVVYHSGYGHTKVQAESVLLGITGVPGVEGSIVTTEHAQQNLEEFNDADCIVFGAPTYMGGASAQFKSFIDATSKIWFKQGWKDKLAAGFTNSGSPSGDKLQTLNSMVIAAMQHGMIWIGTGLVADGTINRLSSYTGAMAESPHGASEPLEPDLQTAKLFGKRIAEATLRWCRGAK